MLQQATGQTLAINVKAKWVSWAFFKYSCSVDESTTLKCDFCTVSAKENIGALLTAIITCIAMSWMMAGHDGRHNCAYLHLIGIFGFSKCINVFIVESQHWFINPT